MYRIFKCMVISVSMVLTVPAFADGWTLEAEANITLTQAAYSDNWVGGEAGSVAWTSNALLSAEKQFQTKVNNKNTLKLAFGQIYNQDKDTKEWIDPLKSTDLIDFETLFRFTLGAFVDPYVAGRLESQFYDDRDPELGRFFNPAEFTESFGALKILFEKDKLVWTARAGTAFKQNMDRDILDALTYTRETQLRNYCGIEFITEFTAPLADGRMAYDSRLTFFKALFSSEADDAAGEEQAYWQQPDMSWENVLIVSITKYVMVNLYLKLLYDKEIDPGLRFKQTLSLGLTFKLE